ncbi:cadherin-related family member 5-like isoform X2 [Heterodontus francisci]|uniref:cadherin-related family member 5-like isoform X2 n=1 Tax=Heterodontus francisci TaxID=7792 RepID=UPI00355B1F46
MDSSLTFPASRNLLFILLAVLQVIGVVENKCSVNQACCVPKSPMRVEENNPMGFVVSNITINEPPVTISDPAAVPEVAVVGSTLQLTTSIDFENLKTPVLLFNLECGMTLLFPVGEPWETVTANDPDNDLIFYSLESTTNGDNYFYLKTENTPEIILDKSLHYEKIKNLQLILHAWEHLDSTSPNDTVTINIQVLDEDNKPPVFLPCSPVANSPASICLNAAYEGNITQETVEKDPLQLQPQQIQAVDGDEGINAVIQYSIIDGAPDNAFNINPSNGAITMTKAVTSLDPIVLTVMAYQVNDHYKYTTTTVTLNVLRLSHYSPQFAKEIYDGTIQENSEAGSIVIGQGSTTKPLQVQAEDYDFPNSSNPSIKYEITPSDHFTINRDGFIFTKTELPAAVSLYDLTVTVTDVENGETNKTQVKVQVIRSNAPTTVTTITQGTGPTKPPTKPAGTGPTTTGASTSSKAPPTAPTTVKTPTTHGTGPSKPPPKPPGTGPTTTGASTPSKPPPGPPGSTAAKPPGPGTGPTPAPATVKTPTTHGTGPPKPPTKPPGTGPTTTGASTPSKAPPGPPGSTAAKPPGPGTGPTTTGASTPSKAPPGPPGSTAAKPPGPGTGPTTTGALTPSKATPGPPGSTTAKPPGPGPTTTKPHLPGSITTANPGPPGSVTPSRKPPDGSETGPTTTPATVKTPTTHGTGPSKPPPKPPGTGPTTTGASTPSKAPPGPPGSTAAKPPGPGPTTTKPHLPGSITTANPGPPGSVTPSRKPPDGSETGLTTSSPAINPRLMYEAKHMAALGVPLAILLIICLIIIGILLNKLYPGKLKWKTIKERTGAKLKFFSRSSYSSKSDKMQFTNEDYLEKGSPNRPHKASWLSLENPPIIESTALASVLDSTVENSSTTGSSGNQTDPTSQRANTAPTAQKDKDTSSSLDQTDYDQEMKSILTKERKSDEGYKSVWFKEDIEPAANEEHVIDRHDDEEEAEEDDHDPGDRDRDGGDLTGHGYFLRMQSDDAASIAL